MTNPLTPPSPEQPRWLTAMASNLAEALPRLHGCPPEPLLQELITGLTTALAEGQVQLALPSPAHGLALASSALAAEPDGPLVLEGDQVLWRRWHEQRNQVLAALVARAQAEPAPLGKPIPASEPSANGPLDQGLDADQLRAVAAVLRHQLVLLEGGPGTGKTSTVARMIAALRTHQPASRIHLAAPTGKAAARLRAALAQNSSDGPLAAAKPLPCTTLHRLLESRGEHFGRNRNHPLALDLLVVDEVSMVDLPLMAALLEALPASCRLVLVGDAAQLPPVGPGAVLRELQAPSRRQALGTAAVSLRTTYRNNGAIAAVAAALREGNTPLEPLLAQLPADANLRWHPRSPWQLPAELLAALRAHQQQLAAGCQELAATAAQAPAPAPTHGEAAIALLAQLDQLLVLSPVRRGRWGVDAVHRALLGETLPRGPLHWPLGTPVLCNHNLVELGLANGDVGLVAEHAGERRLLFAGPDPDAPLWIHPAQLPQAEPALALTVHKAQGSEADAVWLLLPETGRPQQPLLYTGLTRARRLAVLVTPQI
jgi:exodeoxyribonuclease V alpha subunit